jgi:probable HAF family extracellular repeat protein
VGYWEPAGTLNPVLHAFLYQNGRYSDLDTLVDPLAGWTFQEAFDINDGGQITGAGLTAQGKYDAFLLTPVPGPGAIFVPEPASVLSVALAGAGLFVVQWRRVVRLTGRWSSSCNIGS